MRFSAVVAVRDEEEMLEGAMRLLGFCDEIVVVIDDRTVDRTEEIARRFTDKVFRVPFTDFSALKNAGVESARGNWIVFCDADERITPRLASDLQAATAGPTDYVAFANPTVNFFWGHRMRFGGWRESHVRLVRREYARYDGDVHEALQIPPERVGWLDGERWHFSHRSIEEDMRKAIFYGRLDAFQRARAGDAQVGVRTFLYRMLRDFAWRMVRRTGWRDGMPGIIEGIFQPFALFCSAVMLWEIQQGTAIQERYQELERLAAMEV